MKKSILALMLTGLIILTSGCGEKVENPEINNPEQNEIVQPEKKIVKKGEIPLEVLEWNEADSYTGDVDGDGVDEVVMLLTSAEQDEDGEFLWNDGQDWALYVDDKEDDYLFLKKYLNTGSVYFEVLDYYLKDGTEPAINVIETTGAGFLVKNYKFSSEDKGYIETVIYDTKDVAIGGTNRRHSSFPEYRNEQ